MSTNDQLIEQCRREAEERYPMPVFNSHAYINTTDVALAHAVVSARQEACAAALYAERSKPRLTVEEVMEVVKNHHFRDQHPAESADTYLDEMYADLSDRLTAKLNQTNG